MYERLGARHHFLINECDKHLISSNEWRVLAEEDYSIASFFDGSKDTYEYALAFSKLHGFDIIYDIGCAFGLQSEVFYDTNIDYVGIEGYATSQFWNADKYQYIKTIYPFTITPKGSNALAVSILCLGWNCYKYEADEWDRQFSQLSKDFPNALIYMQPEAVEVAKKYYAVVEPLDCRCFHWLHN